MPLTMQALIRVDNEFYNDKNEAVRDRLLVFTM